MLNSNIENPITFRGIVDDCTKLLDIHDVKPGHYFYVIDTDHMYMFNGKTFDSVCIPSCNSIDHIKRRDSK